MNKNKRIRYRHVHALRDLSRCHTFSNVEIKKGVLFRSGYLCKFKKEQANEFAEEFNIGTVIDLRTDAEVKNAPDAHLDGIKYYHIPILEEFDNPLITKENRNKILLDISKNKGGAVKYLGRVYRKMVSDDYCLGQFKKVFEVLLNVDDDKAIIFHCTQGKDRTGVLAALILYAFGLDRGAICYDYRRFNNAYRFKNFMISVLVAFRFMSFKVSKDLYYLQMAHKKLISAVFDEIESKYKSREKFFNDALDLDAEKLQQFRAKFLIKG